MNKVTHFEIVAIDTQRAISFYTNVFGWEFKKWEEAEIDYWVVLTVPPNTPGAINGGLRREMGTDVKERTKSINGFINTIQIESIDETLKKIEENGGEILMEKMTIPELGHIASCYDSEGNVFSLLEAEK